MFIEEKEYSKPQFELVVINSVDIILVSKEEDNEVGVGAFLGFLSGDGV